MNDDDGGTTSEGLEIFEPDLVAAIRAGRKTNKSVATIAKETGYPVSWVTRAMRQVH